MIELSVIIPVYNSESCLQNTVEQVIKVVSGITTAYEIILIDDASSDNSWQVIKSIKQKHAHVNGIRFNKNYGQHNTLLCGITVAKGNYLLTMDDDLEQKPEDIAKLYELIKKENYDLVYGMPLNARKGFFRAITTKIYKRISQIENKKAGEGSSFRIFNATLKNNLLQHVGSLFFLDEIALWYTDNIGFLKVNFQPSQKKTSGYKMGSLFTLSLRVLSLSSTMPLKIVRMMGFYIFIASVIFALYLIYRKFTHQVDSGYTSIMVVILCSTGLITFSLGVIGEYLGNLISLSNKKPSYSIREQV